MTEQEILICDNHIKEYPTPLISTMSFSGAELWCPYCSTKIGMFDGGTKVPETDELKARLHAYKVATVDYLHAHAVRSASYIYWKGKMIEPIGLPDEEKKRLMEVRKSGWNYDIKIEELKK